MRVLKNSMIALIMSLGIVTISSQAASSQAVSAQAAVPTDVSLLKLIEVTKVVEMMNEMSGDTGATDQIMQSMLASMPDINMTKQQRQGFDKIMSKYGKEIMDTSDVESLNQKVIKAYIKSAKQHFNQQEVDAQIDFYSSDVGQSIIDKQPAMMKGYMAEVMPIVMETTMQNMQDIMPRMVADIQDLMAKE